MKEAIQEVHTGEITISTRSVEIDGVDVEKGQVIALYDGKLVSSSPSIETAIEGLIARAEMTEVERITFFYGEGLNQTQANQLADGVRRDYPEVEFEVHDGGQPHYQLIIAFE